MSSQQFSKKFWVCSGYTLLLLLGYVSNWIILYLPNQSQIIANEQIKIFEESHSVQTALLTQIPLKNSRLVVEEQNPIQKQNKNEAVYISSDSSITLALVRALSGLDDGVITEKDQNQLAKTESYEHKQNTDRNLTEHEIEELHLLLVPAIVAEINSEDLDLGKAQGLDSVDQYRELLLLAYADDLTDYNANDLGAESNEIALTDEQALNNVAVQINNEMNTQLAANSIASNDSMESTDEILQLPSEALLAYHLMDKPQNIFINDEDANIQQNQVPNTTINPETIASHWEVTDWLLRCDHFDTG